MYTWYKKSPRRSGYDRYENFVARNTLSANAGARLSLKGELAQEHLRIMYMQIIETTASLSKAVLLYSHMVSHGLIFSHLLKILYW